MNISEFIRPGEQLIKPDNSLLQYCGRIGRTDDGDPEFVWPCTFVRFHFRGTSAAIIVSNEHVYWNNYVGIITDGIQSTIQLDGNGTFRLELGSDMPDCDHMITVFKRQDACHFLTIRGIVLNEGAELAACPKLPERRIEVYGDSVSAGEVSEAVAYIGRTDPEGHEGCYSNSWYSYSWITARKLKTQLHDIAQGGIPLTAGREWSEAPGIGWFGEPGRAGMDELFDRIKYYPDMHGLTAWDFSKYTPHVVIVALGQNDANPDNFMKDDYDGVKAVKWRESYRSFIRKLRSVYPKARIICTTTILGHEANWDRAIGEVVGELSAKDAGISQFLYSLNGRGTPGHIRIPEAEMMAQELAGYIESLGEDIWK